MGWIPITSGFAAAGTKLAFHAAAAVEGGTSKVLPLWLPDIVTVIFGLGGLWALFLEPVRRRRALITSQLCAGVFLLLTAIALHTTVAFGILALLLVAFAVCIQSTSMIADALYVQTLSIQQRGQWLPLRGLGGLLGAGFVSAIVPLTGARMDPAGASVPWTSVFAIASVALLALAWPSALMLRGVQSDDAARAMEQGQKRSWQRMLEVPRDLVRQPHFGSIVLLLVGAEVAAGALANVEPMLLISPPSFGGLGLRNDDGGTVFGVAGTGGSCVGWPIGWVLARKRSPRELLRPWTIVLALSSLPVVALVLLWPVKLSIVCLLVFAQNAGIGAALLGLLLFRMEYVARSRFILAHFAILGSLAYSSNSLFNLVRLWLMTWLDLRTLTLCLSVIAIVPLLAGPWAYTARWRRPRLEPRPVLAGTLQ